MQAIETELWNLEPRDSQEGKYKEEKGKRKTEISGGGDRLL
jgi:hypothetical protein